MLSQAFQPMAVQLSKKATLPLAKIPVTVSCCSSKTEPCTAINFIISTVFESGAQFSFVKDFNVLTHWLKGVIWYFIESHTSPIQHQAIT